MCTFKTTDALSKEDFSIALSRDTERTILSLNPQDLTGLEKVVRGGPLGAFL